MVLCEANPYFLIVDECRSYLNMGFRVEPDRCDGLATAVYMCSFHPYNHAWLSLLSNDGPECPIRQPHQHREARAGMHPQQSCTHGCLRLKFQRHALCRSATSPVDKQACVTAQAPTLHGYIPILNSFFICTFDSLELKECACQQTLAPLNSLVGG